MEAKFKLLGTPVQLLGKAKCPRAYVTLMDVKPKLRGTLVQLLWAKAKCAGAYQNLLG